MVVKKTEIAMGLNKLNGDPEQWENNLKYDRQKEQETAERKYSKRKVIGIKDNAKGNHGYLTADDSIAKKILIIKCNVTLVQ